MERTITRIEESVRQIRLELDKLMKAQPTQEESNDKANQGQNRQQQKFLFFN